MSLLGRPWSESSGALGPRPGPWPRLLPPAYRTQLPAPGTASPATGRSNAHFLSLTQQGWAGGEVLREKAPACAGKGAAPPNPETRHCGPDRGPFGAFRRGTPAATCRPALATESAGRACCGRPLGDKRHLDGGHLPPSASTFESCPSKRPRCLRAGRLSDKRHR